MEAIFVKTFWITVIMLWVALAILYFILTDRKSLERKGHQPEYIAYLRKSHPIRIAIIAVVLPLLILLSAWIVAKITGELRDESQLGYIVVVMIILVIPFKVLDERINQRKIRELALNTRAKVAIDINYKTLHLIFNPWLELILGISALIYGIFYLGIEQWIVYLFLLFPWLMYLTIKGTRYQTRPYLMDNYKYFYTFNLFSFLLFLFFFLSYLLNRISKTMNTESVVSDQSAGIPEILILTAGIIIALGCIGRIGLYLYNYKAFNLEIKGKSQPSANYFPRKLIYFSITVIITLAIAGLGFLSGLSTNTNIEVGTVLEKYILVEDGEKTMHCSIELCNKHQVREYRVCCPVTYDQLSQDVMVKFKSEKGNTITEVIE